MFAMETFAVGSLRCNCTIVADTQSGDAIVVDGGDGVEEVVAHLERRNWRARLLVHTHAHIDHIGDLGALRERTAGAGLLHPADLPLYQTLPMQARWIGLASAPPVVALDGALSDGDVLEAGDVRMRVLHTPGHTPGSVCLAIPNGEATTILSGDTLFAGSIGRWDLGGTSMEDIVRSIQTKLLPYDDATKVIPGHGPFTTIGIERRSNPYLTNAINPESGIAKNHRLFVGIALDENTRQRCAKVAETLQRTGFDARFESPEKYHVTLAFLGNVAPARFERNRSRPRIAFMPGGVSRRTRPARWFPT